MSPVVNKRDHQALEGWYCKSIDVPSRPALRCARWDGLLSKSQLKVEFIKVSTNIVAD